MTKIPESLQDFAKSLMDLDVTKGAEEILDKLAQLQVPGVDMDALVASQRDNLEALSKSNRAAVEGVKGVAEWQMKILKQAIDEIAKTTRGMAEIHSPQELVIEQTEVAKRAFETAVTNMRELSEILNKANEAATRAIVDRVPESLDEIKEVLKVKQ
jgi:phasin family protein